MERSRLSRLFQHATAVAGGAVSIWVVVASSQVQGSTPQAPPLLSQTGLYSDFGSRIVATANRPFAPQYPLWTDGATKQRWVQLPAGKRIDARAPADWVFPVGTRFWKEFAWEGRPVETRYLEKTAAGWIFASYAWRPDGSDADLAPVRGLRDYAEVRPGVRHDIPGTADCQTCHVGPGRDVPLGFTALQLSSDRDPMAPNAEVAPPDAVTLAVLLKERRLAHAPASWRTDAPRIAAATARERAVLGYLHANCSSCHNDRDTSGGLSLQADGRRPAALATAVGVRARFQQPGLAPGETVRITPGEPEKSALLQRMASRNPLRQMPPLGSKVVDEAAVALVRAWIAEELGARDRNVADAAKNSKEDP